MAGLFGFNDYESAGVGIPKNAPSKKRIVVFFEIYFRKFWSLLGLNFIYVLFCLPIVTIGPATAGMTKVLKNYSMERHAFIWGDFWDSFKKNFKKSLIVGIVDIILLVGVGLGAYIYPKMAQSSGNNLIYLAFILSLSVGITLLIMNFYMFPMIVSTDLSLKNIFKNSFYLTCIALKKNIITFVIVLLVTTLFVLLPMLNLMFIIILPFMPASFLGLLICFNCYPIIQKYVINPYYEQRGEENPEYNYLKPLSIDEAVFIDMGGKEKPIEAKPKKKKGKTIS